MNGNMSLKQVGHSPQSSSLLAKGAMPPCSAAVGTAPGWPLQSDAGCSELADTGLICAGTANDGGCRLGEQVHRDVARCEGEGCAGLHTELLILVCILQSTQHSLHLSIANGKCSLIVLTHAAHCRGEHA